MIIKDNFSKFTNISKLSGCIAFFVNEKSEITHLKKYLNSSEHKNLIDLLRNKNKKKGLLSFDLDLSQKITSLFFYSYSLKAHLNFCVLRCLDIFLNE